MRDSAVIRVLIWTTAGHPMAMARDNTLFDLGAQASSNDIGLLLVCEGDLG